MLSDRMKERRTICRKMTRRPVGVSVNPSWARAAMAMEIPKRMPIIRGRMLSKRKVSATVLSIEESGRTSSTRAYEDDLDCEPF